jgi:predicted permease
MDARRVPDLLRGAGRGNVRGSGRVQNALVVLEVALGVVIVAAAGLLVNTALRLARVDLGVQTRDALVFRVTLPETRYGAAGAATNFFESLTRELSTLPAVTAVGLGTREPLSGGTNGNFATSRDADATHLVEMRAVSPAWFDATGQRLVAGRLLTPADARSADALVVNEKLARSLFGPGVAAIGQELRATWTEGRWTIVGIVSDVRDFGPAEDARPTAYWSFGGDVLGTTSMAVVVRTASGARGNTLQLVRERLRSLDADLPVSDPATMTELAHLTIGQERRTSLSLVASFALLGLVLAALGIYAVIAFSVEERRREMGVRMALGATGRTVLGLVCSRALRLAAIGVVIGIAGALLTGRLVAHLLWHVRPADPLTLSATAAVFFFAALLGSMLPARRAARVGVADVLRQD